MIQRLTMSMQTEESNNVWQELFAQKKNKLVMITKPTQYLRL